METTAVEEGRASLGYNRALQRWRLLQWRIQQTGLSNGGPEVENLAEARRATTSRESSSDGPLNARNSTGLEKPQNRREAGRAQRNRQPEQAATQSAARTEASEAKQAGKADEELGRKRTGKADVEVGGCQVGQGPAADRKPTDATLEEAVELPSGVEKEEPEMCAEDIPVCVQCGDRVATEERSIRCSFCGGEHTRDARASANKDAEVGCCSCSGEPPSGHCHLLR